MMSLRKLTASAILIYALVLGGCAGEKVQPNPALPADICDLQIDQNGQEKHGLHLPTVSSVSPAEGFSTGGSPITIEGEGFANGAAVLLGRTNCIGVSVLDAKKLTCIPSVHISGVVDVTVANPDRHCGYLADAYTFMPAVTLSPKSVVLAVGNATTFSPAKGKGPYTFSVLSGGGTVNATSGEYKAPDAAAMAVVRVTDKFGSMAEGLVIINPKLEIQPLAREVAVGNKTHFALTGGVGPFSFSMSAGPGAIDGESGLFTASEETGKVVVKVQDSLGNSAEGSVQVDAAITIAPLTHTLVIANKTTFTTTGGVSPATLSIYAGSGTIDASGAYVAPDKPGTSVIRATDGLGNFAEAVVNVLPGLVLYPNVKTILLGDQITFIALGGMAPLKFSMVSGTGKIDAESGFYLAPTSPSHEVIRVTDSLGNTAEANITVTMEGLVLQKLSSGFAHTCALKDGGVKCWGDNRSGQLGNGTALGSNRPVQVIGLEKGVLAVASGLNHSCALIAGGQVKCWGENHFGQLGNNSIVNSLYPVPVFGLTRNVQSISLGQYHSCAVVNNSALCWGSNRRGQLGNSTTVQSSLPVQVRGLTQDVQQVAAGASHTCALTKGGVKCWGYNYAGQLGDGTVTDALVPVQVKNLTDGVQFLAAGGFHNCAVMSGGAKCWGYNGSGQLGNGGIENTKVPIIVDGMGTPIASISAGYYHTCVLLEGSNQARCWGYNHDGQLGDGTRARHLAPVSVLGLGADNHAISAGVGHTCVLDTKGVRCWGSNDYGQFGNHSKVSESAPIPAVPLENLP